MFSSSRARAAHFGNANRLGAGDLIVMDDTNNTAGVTLFGCAALAEWAHQFPAWLESVNAESVSADR